MTIAEFTCLVRLFEACADLALRRRAIELVPELREWDQPTVLRVVGDSSEILKKWPQTAAVGSRVKVVDE